MLPADIPEDFRVTIMRNAPNPFGVLSSKGTFSIFGWKFILNFIKNYA